MGELSRRHHTVPQMYLRGFAKGDRLGAVRLDGGVHLPMAVSNATVNRDFYNVTDADGAMSDWFEKELSHIEGAAANVLRLVVEDGVWPLDEEDRATLATFLTFQFLRGPDQRNAMSEIATGINRAVLQDRARDAVIAEASEAAGRCFSETEADDVWRLVTAELELEVDAAEHIRLLADLGDRTFPLILGRQWNLIRFKNKNLITCDTPVSLVPHQSAGPNDGLGLANAWAVAFPFSRHVGLMMIDPTEALEGGLTVDQMFAGDGDVEAEPSTYLARALNRSTLQNARQWLFHHPDDIQLIPEKLPAARTAEVRMDPDPDSWHEGS